MYVQINRNNVVGWTQCKRSDGRTYIPHTHLKT